MNELAAKVYDLNTNEFIGRVGGVYHPNFYAALQARNLVILDSWDKKYPGWRKSPVLLIHYEEPRYNLTKEEVAEYFNLPIEQVSDKLYQALTRKEDYMVQPYDSVRLEFDMCENCAKKSE